MFSQSVRKMIVFYQNPVPTIQIFAKTENKSMYVINKQTDRQRDTHKQRNQSSQKRRLQQLHNV